jgi:hypothetical protein
MRAQASALHAAALAFSIALRNRRISVWPIVRDADETSPEPDVIDGPQLVRGF